MRQPILILASSCTIVAVGLSVAGAWQRAGLPIERALFAALVVLLTLSAHMLPALCRGGSGGAVRAGWVLWGACLISVCWGHLAFFSAAERHAGVLRAAELAPVPILDHASGIVARPLTQVAADRARVMADAERLRVVVTRCPDCLAQRSRLLGLEAQVVALETEEQEARRRIALQSEAVAATTLQRAAESAAATDPVASRVAALLGLTPDAIALTLAGLSAATLELVGGLLWWRYRAVTTSSNAPVTVPDASVVPVPETPDTPTVAPPTHEPNALADAVRRGELRPTVAAIRKFLGCSQTRATEVRRRLLAELAGTAGGAR